MAVSSKNANQHVRHVHNLRAHMSSCDITLIAGNLEFPVHRVIMAAHSKRLEELFESNEVENQKEKYLDLQNVTEAGLKAIITFVYDGRLEINQNNAEDIFSAATYLQMEAVVELISKFLNESWTEDNYKPILDIATRLNLTEIRMKILLRYMEDFVINHEKDFLSLKFDEFSALLGSDSLRIESEYKVFELLWKWIKEDDATREVFLPNLMKQVRLTFMTVLERYLVGLEVNSNKECRELLDDATRYILKTGIGEQTFLQTIHPSVRSDYPRIILSTNQGILCLSTNASQKYRGDAASDGPA